MRSFWTNRFWRKYPKISFYDIIIIFLCTYTKIWTFQGKGRYFNIPLKKMVFCSYLRNYEHIEQNNVVAPLFWIAHIYVNTNILTKKTICLDYFKKIVFLLISPKISAYQGKERFLRAFWTNRFWPISPKISTCWEKQTFSGEHFEKSSFLHIKVNIEISRKTTIFWDHFEKIVFCPYARKYQHSEEKHRILT